PAWVCMQFNAVTSRQQSVTQLRVTRRPKPSTAIDVEEKDSPVLVALEHVGNPGRAIKIALQPPQHITVEGVLAGRRLLADFRVNSDDNVRFHDTKFMRWLLIQFR